MGPPNNNAIILSDCGVIKEALCYEDVGKMRDLICEFIAKHVKTEYHCIGLRMSHNIYIPSLVLSLQELRHAFIFLPEELSESESIIQHLGIMWVLSFGNPQNATISLTLNSHTLCLEKSDVAVNKSYQNIYYIIRTSGTTGQNKFVRVGKHCIESNIISLGKIFRITASDTIYFGTPLTFDPSMVELLLALYNRACLLITTPKNKINPTLLYKTLFNLMNGITVLQIVPSLFIRWSHQQISAILANPSLKILAFGGEQFPRSILQYQKADNLRIFNLYGITEVSCWATVYETTPNDDAVPLGDALDDTLIEIRDDEIYVGSDSRVCLVDDEDILRGPIFRATGDVGVVINGKISYKGRKNDVFKRWGHKIHLSKIEELVAKETGLENKCVWLKTKLLLFIIDDQCNDTKDKVIDKIRIKLLHALPSLYFPDYIDFIRKCPITVHGKVDRKVLESIYLDRDKVDKERSCVDTFKLLICKYFGLSLCRVDELAKSTFFDIGGSSILAIQLINEFEDYLGIECSPDFVTALLEKDLAACLDCLKNAQITRKRSHEQKDCNSSKKMKRLEIELKIAWKYNLHACVDSTPLVFINGNRTLVALGSFSHIFVVIDAMIGEEISKFVLPDIVESSPCLSPCQNYLYTGCFDGKMYCLDWRDTQTKWTYSTADRIKCKPVLCNSSTNIVFGSYDKYIHCISVNEGTLVWQTFVSESVISTPLVRRGQIFAATICGTCLGISEATGEILWRYQSGSPIFGAPCGFKNGIMWPCVKGKIVSLTLEGEEKWHYECGGHLYSSLLVHEDSVIFGCHDQNLYILGESGETAKIVYLGDKISCKPRICKIGDKRYFIVVVTDGGYVNLVDFDGFVVGEIQLSNQIFSSPSVRDNRIFVGCRDDYLYCIEF